MSEERMERKCVARSQQPKAGPPDCKKSSDVAHKPWPRSGKKREGGAGSRNEAPRRNIPPARGGAAGRARPLGQRGPMGREEISGLEDMDAELGSVFVPGSKKQSLNHLLQFVCPPREASRHPRPAPTRPRHAPALHPHHTELFLQASCQFAVRADGDYKAHLLDPDLPVNWDQVQHVVMRGGACECPVCLCAPVSARVTRCGHVYCWACALHYADVHPRPAPPCPVCAAPIHVEQLKSASLRTSNTVAEGDVIEMRLVRRLRDQTLVEPAPELPAPGGGEAGGGDYPCWDHTSDLPYAKIVTITDDQVKDIIQRERTELSQQILNEIDTSELPYLERALSLLAQRETELSAVPSVPLARALSPSPAPPVQRESTVFDAPRVDWFDVTDEQMQAAGDGRNEPDVETATVEGGDDDDDDVERGLEELSLAEGGGEEGAGGSEAPPVLSEADKESQAKYFYFYQEASGTQTFLHGLNVRLLTASWGGLAAAPRTIRARLLSVRQLTVTKQSRLHTPCTAHLPLYCPYELVELELAPPHVTRHALARFADELETRARARARAVREERRRERRAAPPRLTPPSPASLHHYPPPQPDLPPPPPAPPVSPPTNQHAPPSFAKMASASGAWRVRAGRPPSPPPGPAPGSDEEAPPPPRALLSDAIEAALLASAATPKNKKKKHRLLYASGVQRSQ